MIPNFLANLLVKMRARQWKMQSPAMMYFFARTLRLMSANHAENADILRDTTAQQRLALSRITPRIFWAACKKRLSCSANCALGVGAKADADDSRGFRASWKAA
jgi:hypothetical protein